MGDDAGGLPTAPSGDRGRPARRFREDEVAAILARAASSDRRTDLPTPHDPTLSDLMAAAAEVGLDPAEVRRAAAITVPERRGTADRVLGAPDRRTVAARLAGARMPPDPGDVVRRVEETVGVRGRVVERGDTRLAWRSDGVADRYALDVRDSGGALEVTLSSDRAGTYFGLWAGGLALWGVLAALTPLGALPLAAKLAGFLVAPVLVARPFWSAADHRVRVRLETAALDVLRVVEEGGGTSDAPTGTNRAG